MAHKLDFVTDMTKVGRLLKRVSQGDMTLTELFLGKDEEGGKEATLRQEGDTPCEKSPGCLCHYGHKDACVFQSGEA